MKGQCLVLDESSKFYDAIKKLDENGNGVCSGLTNCSGPLNLDTFQATFSNSAIF